MNCKPTRYEINMTTTYYGHSCFGIRVGGKHLLFDPFISPNSLASSVDINTIEADFILISHGHADHLMDAEEIARRTGAMIISNYEIVSWYEQKGLTNGQALNHGGQTTLGFGSVKYVNAVHSSVLPDGTYGGNPGGFVVRTDDGDIYYAGDTALTMDMQLIGDSEDIKTAFLPIGDCFTMGIDDAIRCCDMIKCKDVIGMHYDTFPVIELDADKAKSSFSNAGLNLTLMEIGTSIEN
jgi:L-ascorbate metabolism protein UlaG (beta-lactamase superfamily)